MKLSEAELRVEIRDDGPGIAPEDMARLFVPFERLGGGRPGVEGTGLGLALSKRLAEAMGGSLEVESRAGVGSAFGLRLPAAENPEQRLEDVEPSESTAPQDGAEPRTLLYIEDNAPNLRLIERVVGGRPGYRLLSAMQGSLGLELARQHDPDLILLDLNLPDISGAEVLRRLRDDVRTLDIPVVGISADATQDQVPKAFGPEANPYVTKPAH